MKSVHSKMPSAKPHYHTLAHNYSQEEIPETVRLTKERVLRSLLQELNDKQEEEKGKKLLKKYRMIRFFGECPAVSSVYVAF